MLIVVLIAGYAQCLGVYAKRIGMGVVFFVFVVERFELLAPLCRLFPVRDKVGKSVVRQQLARHFPIAPPVI